MFPDVLYVLETSVRHSLLTFQMAWGFMILYTIVSTLEPQHPFAINSHHVSWMYESPSDCILRRTNPARKHFYSKIPVEFLRKRIPVGGSTVFANIVQGIWGSVIAHSTGIYVVGIAVRGNLCTGDSVCMISLYKHCFPCNFPVSMVTHPPPRVGSHPGLTQGGYPGSTQGG